MILIDTNALVVLIVGLLDTGLLNRHKRTSIYEIEDFESLLAVIGGFENLLILPNVWTETDNLLNNFTGNYKYPYIEELARMFHSTVEEYIPSIYAPAREEFFNLGLTDTLLLQRAKSCDLLITADSQLALYANAHKICVYDMVERRNLRLS